MDIPQSVMHGVEVQTLRLFMSQKQDAGLLAIFTIMFPRKHQSNQINQIYLWHIYRMYQR